MKFSTWNSRRSREPQASWTEGEDFWANAEVGNFIVCLKRKCCRARFGHKTATQLDESRVSPRSLLYRLNAKIFTKGLEIPPCLQ